LVFEGPAFKLTLRRGPAIAAPPPVVVEVPADDVPAAATPAGGRFEVKVPAACAGGVLRLFDADGRPLVGIGQRVEVETVIARVEQAAEGNGGRIDVDEVQAAVAGVIRHIRVCHGERVGAGMTILEVE
jgi:biotin carboxyl carrier protein